MATVKYIDKAALVAEIENKIAKYNKRGEESDAKCDGYGMYWGGVLSCLNEVRSFIDTLEVKEVDLEMEKIKNIEKQCPFRKIICKKYEHHPLECNGACGFVCDRITLEKKHQHDIKNVPVDEEKLRNDRKNTI